ncbi:MAG: HlyD family efflux transporter periplasmic adaptor subunit [Planctomycetota bacterium]
MRKLIVATILASAGIVGWLAWRQQQPEPFRVSGFIEADQVRVGSRVGGRVAEVWAEEGQHVHPGVSLYRLDPFDLLEQLAQSEARRAASRAELDRLTTGFRSEEIEQARARRDRTKATLSKLIAGPRPQEIEITQERLNIARADQELAQTEYDRLVRLRSGEQAAKLEFEQAERTVKASRARVASAEWELALLKEGARQEELAEAKATLAEAEQAVALLEKGYRPEEISQAAARLAGAAGEVAAIQVRLRELTVVSPCECLVESVDLHPGDLVAANAPTVSLLDTRKFWVRAYVPESRLGGLTVGQAVDVRLSAAGQQIRGRITYLATEAEFTPRNVQTPEERSKQVFRIKVAMEEGLDRVRPGMTADVFLDRVVAP